MSLLKEISVSATSAWSPVSRSNIIAIGSKEGVGVGFDNYGGELSFHGMDFADTNPSTNIVGKIPIQSRFNSMSWHYVNKHGTECPYGILAGGMADGKVNLWNPAKIIAGKGSDSILGTINRHKGAVNCVQFNPHVDSSHLLATAGWYVNHLLFL